MTALGTASTRTPFLRKLLIFKVCVTRDCAFGPLRVGVLPESRPGSEHQTDTCLNAPQPLPNALGTPVFIPCRGRSVAAAVGESRDSKNICFVHPQQLGHLAHPALHCPRSILYLMRQAIGERSPKRSMQIVKLQNKPNPKNEHLTGETGNPIGEEEPKRSCK